MARICLTAILVLLTLVAPARADEHAARIHTRELTGKIMTGISIGLIGLGLASTLSYVWGYDGKSNAPAIFGVGIGLGPGLGGLGLLALPAGATLWSSAAADRRRLADPTTDWQRIWRTRKRVGKALIAAGSVSPVLMAPGMLLLIAGSCWGCEGNRSGSLGVVAEGLTLMALSGLTTLVSIQVGAALLGPNNRDLGLKLEVAPGGLALRF
jgi:hypothetical protein